MYICKIAPEGMDQARKPRHNRENCQGKRQEQAMTKASKVKNIEILACDAGWRNYHFVKLTTDDGKAIGREVREKKFTALKTNIFTYNNGKPTGWRPGFGSPFEPEINVDRKILRDLRMHLEAIRDGAGPDIDILLDLNFNAKTEGYLKILRAVADLDMFWIEIDSFNPEALGLIRRQSPHPISSCETLLGLREFLPYFHEQAMDVAIIDTPWNGVWQSMQIAA